MLRRRGACCHTLPKRPGRRSDRAQQFRFTGQLRARRTVRVAFARRLGVVWVACSPEVAETERSYSPHQPTRVVENWIDTDGVRREATSDAGAGVRDELNIASEARVLALVGNCGPAKNHELIPSALRAIDTPVELLHVGSRRDESGAETLAWSTLPAQHRVHHLGERHDVPALLAASDLFLLPSLYEGMPLVAAEALCARVPLLAADAVGMRWLASMDSATLVPLTMPAWVKAIAAAVAAGPDHDAIEASATAAYARFTPERGVAEYKDVYLRAVQAGPSFARVRGKSAGA